MLLDLGCVLNMGVVLHKRQHMCGGFVCQHWTLHLPHTHKMVHHHTNFTCGFAAPCELPNIVLCTFTCIYLLKRLSTLILVDAYTTVKESLSLRPADTEC